jgi:hypothetical protein
MCRKKKIKCDGKMPACTHCINYKTECVFTQVEKKRNPPKGYEGGPTVFWTHTDAWTVQNILKVWRTVWEGWKVFSDSPVCCHMQLELLPPE